MISKPSFSPCTRAALASLISLVFLAATAAAAPPDLTNGGVPGDTISFNMGTTGARGWAYHSREDTSESRQIQVLSVAAGSPADGILAANDVILGANGTGATAVNFTSDARKSLSLAITAAEARDPATLSLIRWRAGATSTVTLMLRTMGAYSSTAPYNCPKSAKILKEGLAYIMGTNAQGQPVTPESAGRYSFGTLALLAANDSNDPDNAARMARAQTEARALIPSASTMTQMMADARDATSMVTWSRGHTLIVLTEYYLATGDSQVLPAIEAYAVNIARNQSMFGTLGHIFAEKNLDGSDNGPMGGVYGPVNSTGMPCFLGLLLARECGLNHPGFQPTTAARVESAITRTSRFFAYYAGRGAVPYGEHEPFWQGHENNGKSGLAALCFALQGNRAPEEKFFCKMAAASGSQRGDGHTGAFFNYTWAPLGAAAGGEQAAASHFSRISWMLELNRRWDGGFDYDCLSGEGPNSGAQYNNFRMSTAALLAYALPLRKLHITGRGHDPARYLTSTDIAEAAAVDGYVATSRTTNELVADLGSWSPLVQRRSAEQLATRTINSSLLAQITTLATDPNSQSRTGACYTLGKISDSATANARAATLAGLLTDPDNKVRFIAAESLRYLPDSARLSQLNAILSAAASTATPLLPFDEEDPLHFAHGRLAMLLFYSGNAYGPKGVIYGSKINSPTVIDRNLLYPAIRAVAANPIGQARSTLSETYKNLTAADVNALADTLVDSIQFRAPSDKMFSAGIRDGGLFALEKYNNAEGVPLSRVYMLEDGRGDAYTSALGVLENYAGTCTTVVPDPDVIGFCKSLLTGSYAADAQAVLDAIAADSNPVVATPFKSIQSVTADSPSLNLPSTGTVLHVAATDLAKGSSVYTWRKVHGAGNVTFTPNGTGGSANTAIQFDGVPGKYRFEVSMTDSRGFTKVSSTVPVTLYNSGGTLPPNSPPTANDQAVTLSQIDPTPITLGASDPEGYSLVFTITTQPAHGTLTGTVPNLVYTADEYYKGTDSFTFQVMDSEGQVDSATVSLTITPAPYLYWDGIDLTANPDGGTGTWDNGVTGNWDDAVSNGSPASWDNTKKETAFFGGTAGTVTIAAGGVTVGGLNFLSSNYIINGDPLTFGASGEVGVSTGTATISAVVSGGGAITKTGAGALTLSGANNYTGGTTLSAGTLVANNGSAFGTGAVTVSGASTLNFSPSLTIANDIAVDAALGMKDIMTTANTITFSGVLSGSSAISIANNGNNGVIGEFAFTNTANTFTGDVITASGSVAGDDRFSFKSIGDGGKFTLQKAGHQCSMIHTGSSDITFDTRAINLGAISGIFDGGGVTPVNSFRNNGTGTVTFNSNLTVAGINAAGATFFFAGTNSGANTFAGTIPNSTSGGNLGIGKTDTGKWILTGLNSYAGETLIRNGILSVDAITGITDNQPLGKNAVVQLGHNGDSGILEFTGTTNSITDKTIRIGSTHAGGTGSGSILNNGTGSLTFSATDFNPTITGITATRILTLGGTYTGTNEIQGVIRDNVASTGKVGITKSGAGIWKLSGSNTYIGVTTISAGVLEATTLANGGTASSIGQSSNAVTSLVFGAPTATLRYTGSSNVTIDRSFTLSSGAGGGATIESSGTGTLAFDNTVALAYGTASQTRVLTLGGNNTGNNSFGKVIANNTSATSLVKAGTGTWLLTAANTYTGGTTIHGGTLGVNTIADSGTSALGTSGALTLNGGTLSYSGASAATTTRVVSLSANSGIDLPSGALTLGAGINGGGFTLTKSGTGTLTLTGSADNGSLFLNVTGGIVQLDKSAGGARAVAGISGVSSGATVKLTGTGGDQIYDGSNFVSTNGVNGLDGTLDLNGRNETTSNLNGTSGIVDNTSATACTFSVGNQNVSSTFGGTVRNTGGSLAITKIGAGTLTLSGNNTYTGTTAINAGTLAITGATQGTSAITVGASGTLGLDIASPVTASSAAVTLGGTVLVTGSPTLASYTLLSAASITGTPALATTIPGYTLVIEGNALKLNSTVAVSAYTAWANTNAPTGNPNDDSDGDGVSNALEFVLGGTKDTKDLSKLPACSTSGGNLRFTFLRDQASINPSVVLTIEVSPDLVSWPSVYTVPSADTGGVVNPGVTVVSGAVADTVTLTVPQDSAMKFARLKVLITP